VNLELGELRNPIVYLLVKKYPECKKLQEWYESEWKKNIGRSEWCGTNSNNTFVQYKIDENTILFISDVCVETYPCEHRYYLNKEKMDWDVFDCVEYFKMQGKNPPEHFKCYIGGKKEEFDAGKAVWGSYEDY